MDKPTGLYKAESEIHGNGIFTQNALEKGESFYQIPTGNISSSPKAGWAHIGDNVFVSDGYVLNSVNHSCEPNAEIILGQKIWLRALQEIKQEDEVTVDYNKTEINGNKVECLCGSEKCRGYFLRIE